MQVLRCVPSPGAYIRCVNPEYWGEWELFWYFSQHFCVYFKSTPVAAKKSQIRIVFPYHGNLAKNARKTKFRESELKNSSPIVLIDHILNRCPPASDFQKVQSLWSYFLWDHNNVGCLVLYIKSDFCGS